MQKGNIRNNQYIRVQLKSEFARRLSKNSRYSLRAFARDLDIDSSLLSKVLSERRTFSDRVLVEIANKIGLDLELLSEAEDPVDSQDYELIAKESFAVISDWHHFAILDLTLVEGFKSDVTWIAKKLNLSVKVAREAIQRMLRIGLLVESKGQIKKGKDFYTNMGPNFYTGAHKEYQRQVLNLALKAIDDCPKELKEISSMTIAADPKKIDAAKEKIKRFRRQLCSFLEDGQKKSVYHLCVQLYPVTKFEESK